MPHLQKAFADFCGVELPDSPPDFPSNFIKIPAKYIVVSTTGSWNSKKYDYYQKVLEILFPILQKEGIEIVQVGTQEDQRLPLVVDYTGVSLRQAAFVIENSLLHVGNDNLYTWLAGSKVPSIALYGPVPGAVLKPEGVLALEPARVNKPSYAPEENPKTINSIPPEQVAGSVTELLNIEKPKIKTVQINSLYGQEQIDYIPDFPIQPQVFNGRRIICRYDICNNKEALIHFLNLYEGAIYTADVIDINLLLAFKPRIPQILYLLDHNYSKDFVKALHSTGIPYDLVTNKKDRELGDLKLDLFDYNQIKGWPEVDKGEVTEDCYFESKRVYLSKAKFYASRWHYTEGIDITKCDFKVGPALTSRNFQESWHHCYFYQK